MTPYFSSLHDMQCTYGSVFDAALHVKGVPLKIIIRTAAGEPLLPQLKDCLCADILDDLSLEQSSVGRVIAREQEFERIGELRKLFQPTHAAQQPFVVRCVAAV